MAFRDSILCRHICTLTILVFLLQTLMPHGYAAYRGFTSPPPQITSKTSSWGLRGPLETLANFLIPPANAQTGPELLASTPEFDLNDRYLIDKAAELGNDTEKIFEYVRDEIGYEVYKG